MNRSYMEYVPVFKAISDESRLKIINMLSCGKMCACDILEKFDISQSTLSYHMKILTDSGLINVTRDGQWMRYEINKDRVDMALSFLTEITSHQQNCVCKKSKSEIN